MNEMRTIEKPQEDLRTEHVVFQDMIAANTRENHVSRIYRHPFKILIARTAFELNCQRLLEISFHVIAQPAVPDDVLPYGFDLLADRGADNYIVGDGQEGQLKLVFDRAFDGNQYICVSCNNTDVANAHALDTDIEVKI